MGGHLGSFFGPGALTTLAGQVPAEPQPPRGQHEGEPGHYPQSPSGGGKVRLRQMPGRQHRRGATGDESGTGEQPHRGHQQPPAGGDDGGTGATQQARQPGRRLPVLGAGMTPNDDQSGQGHDPGGEIPDQCRCLQDAGHYERHYQGTRHGRDQRDGPAVAHGPAGDGLVAPRRRHQEPHDDIDHDPATTDKRERHQCRPGRRRAYPDAVAEDAGHTRQHPALYRTPGLAPGLGVERRAPGAVRWRRPRRRRRATVVFAGNTWRGRGGGLDIPIVSCPPLTA